jgi:predicted nucleotidyltransferase
LELDFGFHYSPYNFDSKAEKDFFEQLLVVLNENPQDIEDIYFTGGISDPNKTDFIFEYKGKDGRWHNYTPDFLIKKKNGKMLIVEIKAEPFRDEAKEKAIKEIEGLNPDRLKYEILITDKDEIGFENINKVKERIYEYKTKDAIKEAIEFGIDVTLLYERILLTPTERLERHQQALEFAQELRRRGKEDMVKVKELLFQLKKHNVRYVIIGGQAAVLQGSAYITADIDICYDRATDNLENLVKALIPFHPRLRGVDKDLPFIFDAKSLKMGLNFTFSTNIGDIDLFGEIQGIGNYEEVVKYSEILEIYGIPCNVLTIEGLIKSKKAVARPKDIMHVKELEALLEIRRQQKKGIKKDEK